MSGRIRCTKSEAMFETRLADCWRPVHPDGSRLVLPRDQRLAGELYDRPGGMGDLRGTFGGIGCRAADLGEPVQAVTALIVVLIPTGVPRGSGSHLAEDGFSRVGLAGVALSSSRAS